MEIQDKEVTATVPAGIVIRVITSPTLTAEELLLEVDGIRDHATTDYQQFEAAGRVAHIQRMSELYRIFFVVTQGSFKKDVLDKMRAGLGDKVRKNTKEAAVFIRYTFAKLDDKQVHVAAVGLEYAITKQVQPAAYVSWVNSFKDKWEGIRAAAAKEKAGKEPTDKVKLWELGMDWARGAEPVETINLRDAWDEAEEARIYVATANGDNTAALKAMHLKPERVQAVLAIYATEVKERNKDKTATKRVLSNPELKVKRNYEAKLVYNKQLVDEHLFNIKQFKDEQKFTELEAEKGKLAMVRAELKVIRLSLAAFDSTEMDDAAE